MVKKFLFKIYAVLFSWRYPYITKVSVDDISVKLLVNYPIDEFRVKKLGGERKIIEMLLKDLRSDDNFFDIGCQNGLYSVLAAKIIKKGQVVAVDPEDGFCEITKSNMEINHIKNYKIFNVALCEENKKVRLYSSGIDTLSPSQKKKGDKYKIVDGKKLDTFVKELGIYPTVLKIDVEGAEYNVLKGMKDTFMTKNPPRVIYIEIHPNILDKEVSLLEKLIETSGYKKEFELLRNNEVLCKYTRFSPD